MADIPVINARRDGVQLIFWCDHCRREHIHGVCGGTPECRDNRSRRGRMADPTCICPPGSGDGHRVAHCHRSDSPYDDTGYILKETP